MSSRSERSTDGSDNRRTDSPREATVDTGIGPHSPAAHDVSLSANDVTTDGVIVAREEIEANERAAEGSTPRRSQNTGHPREDPDRAQAADVRDGD